MIVARREFSIPSRDLLSKMGVIRYRCGVELEDMAAKCEYHDISLLYGYIIRVSDVHEVRFTAYFTDKWVAKELLNSFGHCDQIPDEIMRALQANRYTRFEPDIEDTP